MLRIVPQIRLKRDIGLDCAPVPTLRCKVFNMPQDAPPVTESLPSSGTGVNTIAQIVAHSDSLINQLRDLAFEPQKEKQLLKRYSISQMAEMVGKTPTSIRRAEAAGDLPKPTMSAQGRRTGYTLAEVNRARDFFGVVPGRAEDEEPIRMAFQNFKGGVGKSTLCTHFSQYLAQQGHRVLVIDCDSQASTTTTFGIRPDLDLDDEDTLLPFFDGTETSLDYAIRSTYWDRLDIIPANLGLYSAEYELAAKAGTAGPNWIDLLNTGIATVEDGYDVIIMDPPPALGMISLNVARSANALIVPTPPAMYDFHSTVTFFRMMEEVLTTVEEHIDEPVNYKFMKLLISKYDPNKSAQEFVVKMMGEHYTRHILKAAIKNSAEIDNAGADWRTVYELEKESTSRDTYKRCLASLNSVFKEIEVLIRETWPSHKRRLEAEGHMVL